MDGIFVFTAYRYFLHCKRYLPSEHRALFVGMDSVSDGCMYNSQNN
jgi:hypothetical protein